MTGIYKITNNKNGKCYIGQSIDVEARIQDHKYKSGYEFYQTKELYQDIHADPNAFEFSILCTCEEEDLNDWEAVYIEKYNSVERGYNTAKHSNRSNHYHSTKAKRNIRLGMLGHKVSSETKQRMSEAATKRWNKHKGITA